MLNITKQSDYGLLFISYLSGKDRYVPLSELIRETKLPKRFLARIAAELVKQHFVDSKEGKIGGYKITDKALNSSLYEFLSIFEGELAFTKCTQPDFNCSWDYICQHKTFLRHSLNKIVSSELKKWKLKDLFKN